MNKPVLREVEIISPQFTEQSAKESVEKAKRSFFRQKKVKWISSVPLYLPFWFVTVEMDLLAPRAGNVQNAYLMMVNAITNRGLLVKGILETQHVQTKAIFMEEEVSAQEARETARIEALVSTKRMIKPPPHRVLPGERLVWYPLALVKLEINGAEEIQVFDYYRGGLDKYTMRFLKLKDRLSQTKKDGKKPVYDTPEGGYPL